MKPIIYILLPHIMAGFEVVRANTCALPQYSQAVKFGDSVYCSGDIGAVPGTDWQLAQGSTKDRAVSLIDCTIIAVILTSF